MAKRRRKPHRVRRPLHLITCGPPGFWWNRINETPDPTSIRQEDPYKCVAACLQMLLWPTGAALTQDALCHHLHASPTVDIDAVLPWLESADPSGHWGYEAHAPRAKLGHLHRSAPWLAFMVTHSKPPLHAVIVDGADRHGRVLIRDPYNGTSYRMTPDDFDDAWGGHAIFRRRLLPKANTRLV